MKVLMELVGGLEPSTYALRMRRTANCATPALEQMTRLELAASSLGRRRSAIELHLHTGLIPCL